MVARIGAADYVDATVVELGKYTMAGHSSSRGGEESPAVTTQPPMFTVDSSRRIVPTDGSVDQAPAFVALTGHSPRINDRPLASRWASLSLVHRAQTEWGETAQ